jgi:acyl-CoA synthetase (AMP-forming)/AMP-acid ligase II
MTSAVFRDYLRDHLQQHAKRTLLRIVIAGGTVDLTGREILERSSELARCYRDAPEGGVVLLLLPHSVELVLLHVGLILECRIPAILAWPTSRVDPEKYQRNLLHQLRNLPARQLITLPQLAKNMEPALSYRVTPCRIETADSFDRVFAIPPEIEMSTAVEKHPAAQTAPEGSIFLQFSGGTTGAQKAVLVTAEMLMTQVGLLRERLAFTQNDRVVSWLPLYHDMGLVGCLWFPLLAGAASLHFSATDWLLNPESLFEHMENFRGTFCWLPNFAFSYLAAQKGRMRGSYSLEQVRAWISCSEPVRQTSMNSFVEAFSEWGVTKESVQASYAMAENVFAVTQTAPGEAPQTCARSELPLHRPAPVSELAFDVLDAVYVSSGKPLAGVELRIVSGDKELTEKQPGEIVIRTESLFSGYWGKDGFVKNTLAADGWYSTGDYGFLAAGDLYVIGRLKDIVIVGGQNVFPEDVEVVVNGMEGIYPGRVAAFGVEDRELATEALAVIAELRGEYSGEQARLMQRDIKTLVLSVIGIAPRYVFVVPERWIVKSTAGKISRRETRVRFLQEKENLVRDILSNEYSQTYA